MKRALLPMMSAAVLALLPLAAQTPRAHTLTYAPGKAITLSLPESLDISVAATGLKRARFFAQAPD
ncbi:MAG TPA: hypothetical protein VG893_03870, partial [Terracidiphilus sp.]|nr:hypothetical protein [Terracidiphilus sp.]